ncbi:MAG: NYN domain-containing protein [Candidatus Marinimicrobia bacterium]|nr:NYN domain-containing protein [Candidatus Neomarinimicrobiota bacterium]
MIANVYVDGFGLYYGSLKNTIYKWLDIGKLCNEIYPELSIKRIRYFTAKIDPRKNDPGIQDRQKAILRALKTIPNLSIVYGMYRSHYMRLPSGGDYRKGIVNFVEVFKTEEKGSDVNLATYMMDDAYRGEIEVAVLISNDTDFLSPLKFLGGRQIKVWILSPTTRPNRSPASLLINLADRADEITVDKLRDCQFPTILSDKDGTFTKLTNW